MERAYLPRQGWAVERPRINQLFTAGLEYPLVSVVAGPGYGKTTALAAFCHTLSARLAWVRLLPLDNDCGMFWGRFVGALKHELPQLAQALSKMQCPGTPGAFHSVLLAIDGALLSGERMVLVLDGAEHLDNEVVCGFLDSLIKAELENLCIFITSNIKPGAAHPLGSGRHLRVNAGDLQFTDQETAQLFAQYGRKLGDAEAKRLNEHTGGWPLALHLIASQPQQARVQAYGEIPYMQVIAEMFELRYYAAYEKPIRELLVKLTLFETVTVGLVQALGVADLRQAVAALGRNIFISYDHAHELFCFQKMYRGFLAQKQAALSEAQLKLAYGAAGEWFWNNGFYPDALRCFWANCNYGRFIEGVLALPKSRQDNAFTNWILERLERIPAAFTAQRDEVEFCRGFMYLNDEKLQKAKEIFLGLIDRLKGQRLDAEQKLLLGDAYAVLIDIAFMQNTLEGMAWLQKALPLLPRGTRIRCEKTLVVGNNPVFFLPDAAPGGPRRMEAYMGNLAPLAERLYNSSGRGYSTLFMAESAYCRGQMGEVLEYGVRAAQMAHRAGQHDIAANALFIQLRAALYQCDSEKAAACLEELKNYIDTYAPLRLAEVKDCAIGLFCIRTNNPDNLPLWLCGAGRATTALPLDNGRRNLVCALCRYTTGHVSEAYTALLELDATFRERRLWAVRLTACILKAACLLQSGEEQKAIRELWQAYTMAAPSGITIYFTEFGRTMLALLELVYRQEDFAFSPKWLDRVKEEALAFTRRQAIMLRQYGAKSGGRRQPTELSPRENEVLEHLAKGLAREDIAELMGISLHGIKKHITNIYNKLGAVNRVDAIHIALTNGLLRYE